MHPIIQAVLITVLAGLALAAIIYVASKMNNTASKKDVEKALSDANEYTDKSIINHEKVHKEISIQYTQIQTDLTIIKNRLLQNSD
jgi:hypothetical protein